MSSYKDLFLLDPNIHFLNHGSFGACPKPVFTLYQDWQRMLEEQPVRFLGREFANYAQAARQALADYLGAEASDLVYISNATTGVNIIARSLQLQAGDEVLTTDHEYGACDKTWTFQCRKTSVVYRRQAIPLPVPGPDEFMELFWQGVNPHTRLIYISHITSSTAQRFPVEAVCQRARQEGILTLIDGAHAPGQIPLYLNDLGADFYTGNCHKWMLAPKGAAFLYARKEVQSMLEPLVVSWGWEADEQFSSGSEFIDHFQWTGTRDPSAFLAVPAAIRFLQEQNWPEVQRLCHTQLSQALLHLSQLTGLPPVYRGLLPGDGSTSYALPPQMGISELPAGMDLIQLKAHLYDDFRVEVPMTEWNGRGFVRLSLQAYNTPSDLQALYTGLRSLL